MKNKIKKYGIIIFSFLLIFVCSYFKFGFLLGHNKMYFSGVNFLVFPLTMLLGSFSAMTIFPALFLCKKFLGIGGITLGIPTLIASFYCGLVINKNYRNYFLREMLIFLMSVILPGICMLAFILHPQGRGAYIYSFYWFIPVGLYILNKVYGKTFFSIALTGTFLAHAVGSVMWLYTVSMPREVWIALIPIVAVERLLFAVGGTVIYLFVRYIIKRVYANFIANGVI